MANFTCDGRSKRSELVRAFPGWSWAQVTAEEDLMWAQKEEANGERRCRERAAEFVRWLRGRREKVSVEAMPGKHALGPLSQGAEAAVRAAYR